MEKEQRRIQSNKNSLRTFDSALCGCVEKFVRGRTKSYRERVQEKMNVVDLVVVHNKSQFMAMFYEGLATAKQLPVSLRQHLAFARSVCKQFLKPHQRMQRIAQQKIPLDKGFDSAGFTTSMENLRQLPEVKSNAALTGAMSKLDESIKGQRQPTLEETVELLSQLSKTMPLPPTVLKPTLVVMVNAGTFDTTEVEEIAAKVTSNPFTADQMWDAIADRVEATRDGRIASYRKQGKTAPVQRSAAKAGYFQVLENVPKDKQFATMPITPGLANAMACGPQRANFTHLDACDHPAARTLIEDLTNILLVGTNVAEEDRDKSVAITLRSMGGKDPMDISFRTIIDKSTTQPAPSGESMSKQPVGGLQTKTSGMQPPAGEVINVAQVFEQLVQMGQGVTLPLDMLEAVFAQLVSGKVATTEEVDRAKAELKSKSDEKGHVSFVIIQDVFMSLFGSKLTAGTQK